MTTMPRRFFFLAAALFMSMATLAPTGASAATGGVTFHFYGALNCPPCMAFKRNYLSGVRDDGAAHGFDVRENIIPRLQEMDKVGIYGPSDAILRAAGEYLQLSTYYPPIFFVTVGDEVTSAYSGNWQQALDDAIAAAKT